MSMLIYCPECNERIKRNDYCNECNAPITDNALLREILNKLKKNEALE